MFRNGLMNTFEVFRCAKARSPFVLKHIASLIENDTCISGSLGELFHVLAILIGIIK